MVFFGCTMVEKCKLQNRIILTLRPNRSATWFQSKLFLLVMMIPMFTIAIGWSFVGAWPILPFAGLEFLVLAYVTYLVSYRNYQKDSITIEKDKLTISSGVGAPNGKSPVELVLLRPQTHLYVTKPKKPMDLPILHLADHKLRLEIGQFLNEQDREQLRDELIDAGVVECVDRWWQA